MKVYYNENDAFCIEWLKNLMLAGEIPYGEVDGRSIADVRAGDLKGFDQCHFFAGISGWAYALKLAGWGDRPVWTGSCPCQPFSVAGKRQGAADKRHLWPVWFELIRECRPVAIIGEQVEGAVRLGWLDGVFADLEGEGYACGAAVLGAHSVGAPHVRQRLYWVADAECNAGEPGRSPEQSTESAPAPGAGLPTQSGRCGDVGGVANTEISERQDERAIQNWVQSRFANGSWLDDSTSARCDAAGSRTKGEARNETRLRGFESRRDDGRMGNTDEPGSQGRGIDSGKHADQFSAWASGQFIGCADGKARRIEPSIFPLVDGISNRVGLLRGAGNAIVPQCAAAFIEAYIETAYERK